MSASLADQLGLNLTPEQFAVLAGKFEQYARSVQGEASSSSSASSSPAVEFPVDLLGNPLRGPHETEIAFLKRKRKAEDKRIADLEALEITESEKGSLNQRLDRIGQTFHPEVHPEEFGIRSTVSIDGIEDAKVLKAKFAELDKKYTELGIHAWKVRQAYHEKHVQVKGLNQLLEIHATDKKKLEQDKVKIQENLVKEQKEKESIKKHASAGNGCQCPKTSCSSNICGCVREKISCQWGKNGCKCTNPKDLASGALVRICGNRYSYSDDQAYFSVALAQKEQAQAEADRKAGIAK